MLDAAPPALAVPVLTDRPPPAGGAPERVEVCLDCGAPRLGPYCHRCGQHHLDDRLTLRVIWREFAERFLKLELGLFATVRLAVLDPGRLAREYVYGRRRRYMNPVSFLLLGSALAVLLIPLYGSADRLLDDDSMPGQSRASLSRSIDTGIRIAGGDPGELSPEEREQMIAEAVERNETFIPAYIETVGKLYSVLSVVLAFALAAFLKLFFSGRPQTYTFAETLVLGCFFAGAYAALTSVVASALAPFALTAVSSVVTTVVLIAGSAYAATGFYERSWGTAALGAVSGIVALVVYFGVIIVVGVAVVLATGGV